MKSRILPLFEPCGGVVSFVYQNLVTGERFAHQEHYAHVAASVIKIPVMVEAFRQFEAGLCDRDEIIEVKDADRVPICGVLTLMHSGLRPTVMDLIYLMISISDNMATNLLIDRLGMGAIGETMQTLGMGDSLMARKLFDKRPGYKEKNNLISAADIAMLLEGIYRGTLLSSDSAAKMLGVLLTQQLKNKTPALLPAGTKIAHKTGEDSGISHDVAIVYADQPFVLTLCGSGLTDVPAYNRMAGDVAKLLFGYSGGQ